MSFSVNQGEIFALLGANGAGKTTTIECLEGLRKWNVGEIEVEGVSVAKSPDKIRKILGIQLQSTALADNMTAKEAMQLFCAWHSVTYRGDLLERFDMGGEYLNKTYVSLSTGRKRRLHLALALCHRPRLLVLDEPTAGLDVEGRNTLHQEIRRLRDEGVTILMATHDMAEAETLSDYIAILRGGVIAREGTPMELTAASDIQSRVLVKTRNDSLREILPHGLEKLETTPEGYSVFKCKDAAELLLTLLPHIQKHGDTVTDLRVARASIEDIFLSVAGGAK
ncbi:MAG: ABC transporter ATP-binding protein [Clostridiales bacterium]|nr:ABC transporter ATP-binding protein [Clostridiales bacterium]